MLGSTLKTYSLEELKALPSLTDWERVRREAREEMESTEDEDSPDASALMQRFLIQQAKKHGVKRLSKN